jgi:predicted MPP superfamily phosphohydrolase
MPSRRPARRRAPARIIALRAAAYFVAAWGTIALLAAGAFPGALAVALALAVYCTLPLVLFIRWRGWPFYPSGAFRLIVVRPVLYGNLLLPLVAAAGAIGLLAGAPFGQAIVFGRFAALVVLAAMAVLLFAGYVGSHRLVVRQVDAYVPGLSPSFDGLRIAQLSDLHVGPHSSRGFLDRVARATGDLAPDIIAVTGDLVDDRAEDVAVYARVFGSLEAPHGVFVIPGNHDVYAGWEAVERQLRERGLGTVLVNEARIIRRGSDEIAIVGTGDPAGGWRGDSLAAPDIDRTLAGVPTSATVIAFAHNPALWPALAARGVALTLSGHTHWGQFALPQLGWSLASPFLELAMGAHVRDGALLYISPGTGYWGIPFRIGARPEITLVTLRRVEAEARVEARDTAPLPKRSLSAPLVPMILAPLPTMRSMR